MVPTEKREESNDAEASKPLTQTIARVLGKHSLEDDELVVTGNVQSPHNLGTDAKTRHQASGPLHQLHQDATAPPQTSRTQSDHDLSRDPVADLASPVAFHDLPKDQTTHFSNPDHGHNIGRDVLVGSGKSKAGRHGITAHKPIQSHATRPAHHLNDDGTTESVSRSSGGHVLDRDAKVDSSSRASDGKHNLEDHAAVNMAGNKVVGSHEPDKK